MNELYESFIIEKTLNEGIGKRQQESYNTTFNKIKESGEFNKLEDFTEEKIMKFYGKFILENKWSSNTYNHNMKNLKCFFNYLEKKGKINKNPLSEIKKRKEAKKLPKTLKKENVKELLRSLNRTFDNIDFVSNRNIILVKTYLYTGARLSELLKLKIDDISISDEYIKIVNGKGQKERIIPIHKKIKGEIKDYLKKRNEIHGNKGLVFCSISGKELQKRDTRLIIEKIRDNISFHFTWHQLRHTFATELIKNNFDIYNVSQILGHSKIETTKIYLSLDVSRFKNKLNKIELFA